MSNRLNGQTSFIAKELFMALNPGNMFFKVFTGVIPGRCKWQKKIVGLS